MAGTLMDAINQSTSAMAGQQQGVTGTTDQAAKLLRAKQGTAVTGGPYQQSALGETQAVSATNQTMQNQVAPAAQLQQSQLQTAQQGQQQQTQQQLASVAQQGSALQSSTADKVNATLQQASQAKGSVDTQRYTASLEQAGFQLRLANQQYVQTLKQNAALGRLDQEGNFKEQLASATFGDNLTLLNKKLGQQSVLNSDDNQWKKQVAQIDIGTAWDMLGNQLKGTSEQQTFAGMGALTTAGVGAYGASDKASTDAARDQKVQDREDYRDARDSGADVGSFSDYTGNNGSDMSNYK